MNSRCKVCCKYRATLRSLLSHIKPGADVDRTLVNSRVKKVIDQQGVTLDESTHNDIRRMVEDCKQHHWKHEHNVQKNILEPAAHSCWSQ